MVDAAISRVRLRDLARLGSIADGTPPRPRAAGSRPGADDLVASTI
jgi:hypothetical protein